MADERIVSDLVVVGGGPGGYAAAFLAADHGMEVTLVDPEPDPGGVCLYRGCIPSKALLHVAKLIGEAKEAEAWGVSYDDPRVDLDRLRSFKERVVTRLTKGVGELRDRRGVRHVRGLARFRNAGTLDVNVVGGGRAEIGYRNVVLATGSSPARLPGSDPNSRRLLDSTSALDLPEIPGSLLVVGGGYIGLELGTVYARLGSRVTVVEMTSGLLPGVDPDLVRPLRKQLDGLCESILVDTRVAKLEERRDGMRVTLEGKETGSSARTFDRVLVSIGRTPNSRSLGLEHTRVEVGDDGFVEVNAQLRTADPSIYAIGDLVGQPMLAHKASHEGRTAVEAIAGKKVAFEPRAIPAVVYTDPEIAWCGLTENEAKRAGTKVDVVRYPWAASGRAITFDRTEGVTKLVIDPGSGRILGAGIAGVGAGELIAEMVVAIEAGFTAGDLDLTIHPHPTLSETLMEAAAAWFGTATHVYRPKRSSGKGPSRAD